MPDLSYAEALQIRARASAGPVLRSLIGMPMTIPDLLAMGCSLAAVDTLVEAGLLIWAGDDRLALTEGAIVTYMALREGPAHA